MPEQLAARIIVIAGLLDLVILDLGGLARHRLDLGRLAHAGGDGGGVQHRAAEEVALAVAAEARGIGDIIAVAQPGVVGGAGLQSADPVALLAGHLDPAGLHIAGARPRLAAVGAVFQEELGCQIAKGGHLEGIDIKIVAVHIEHTAIGGLVLEGVGDHVFLDHRIHMLELSTNPLANAHINRVVAGGECAAVHVDGLVDGGAEQLVRNLRSVHDDAEQLVGRGHRALDGDDGAALRDGHRVADGLRQRRRHGKFALVLRQRRGHGEFAFVPRQILRQGLFRAFVHADHEFLQLGDELVHHIRFDGRILGQGRADVQRQERHDQRQHQQQGRQSLDHD